ncbi:MAG: hypothetical protein FWC11_03685 [Firmicutes bacterium]|nr:hypothetical protein [Bacillota bacterium]
MTRVFDPFDAECEYKQNPTEQSKTVVKGLLILLTQGVSISKAWQGVENP